MSVSAINNSTPSLTSVATPSVDSDFSITLHKASQKLRKLSEKLVSLTFLHPLLSQLRDDPLKVDLFHGGFAEDAFGAQLDNILAERITAKADFPIVEIIHQTFMKAVKDRPDALERAANVRLDLLG